MYQLPVPGADPGFLISWVVVVVKSSKTSPGSAYVYQVLYPITLKMYRLFSAFYLFQHGLIWKFGILISCLQVNKVADRRRFVHQEMSTHKM